MSHPEIFIQTSNLTPGAGGNGGGGGGAGGGDTPIGISISSADLSNRLHIDTSKIKENEDASLASNGDGAGASTDSAGGQQGLTQDSLNIVLLKRPVVEIPKSKQPEYAYRYSSTDTLAAELSEWFSYSLPNDLSLLLLAKQTFEESYPLLSLPPHQSPSSIAGKRRPKWSTSKIVKRKRFIARSADLLEHANQKERVKGLQGLAYIVEGVFGESSSEDDQLAAIKRNVALVRQAGVVEPLFNCLRGSVGREWEYGTAGGNPSRDEMKESDRGWNRKELRYSLTILYFLIEVTRHNDKEEEGAIPGMDGEIELLRDEVADLPGECGLLGFLAKTLGRLRWEDSIDLPLVNILLLTWKAMLLVFGEADRHLPKVKTYARGLAGLAAQVDNTLITASPLDYHMFRQDIMAKYPAYDPPKPLFPFELAANSFLPSAAAISIASGRTGGSGDVLLGGKGGSENLGSILDKAVHIATPAPSPPPSPGGVGGKGSKKQNYQTNNNFPFLYPPSSSSEEVDKKFAGRCWWKDDDNTFTNEAEGGGGVPTSIKEAADLFSGRVRSTLAMKQLWDEREAFLKFQRGWDVDEEILRQKREVEVRERRWEEKRLESVEEFYKAALPQLQSFVIVLLKVILANVNSPPSQPPHPPPAPSNSQQVSFSDREDNDSNKLRPTTVDPVTGLADFASSPIKSSWNIFARAVAEKGKGRSNGENGGGDGLKAIGEDGSDVPVDWEKEKERERTSREDDKKRWDESDAQRIREITSKAVSAILVGMLKWFRVSHVLKFEYLTQLLLDSNYLPLILRLLNQQDIATAVTAKTDRADMSFFSFCNLHSLEPRQYLYSRLSTSFSYLESSPDEACPPPIPRCHRDLNDSGPLPPLETPPPSQLPPETITDFSWRNFFTTINFLRAMQKIVKNKSHRNLSLVQYKSSTILRKPLKCPQHELRLYTLKVFKGQVPYCGRKWRQSNMRVITSIYLFCRPELKDDWLSGGDVDAEIEESLPHEQALRSLTHFYNIRRYPKSMGADMEMIEQERDFFRREIERMEVVSAEEEELNDWDAGGLEGWG